MEDHIQRCTRSEIIYIVRRSLGYIDRRLVDHGERVAYIADRIAAMDDTLGVDRDKLLLLSLLHDIGAYKTEEIDDMMLFETDTVLNHAAYGYVFLRNATTLGDFTEAVLYHHMPYQELMQRNTSYATYAALISLADRVDIILMSGEDPALLRPRVGTLFCPNLTALFFDAEAKFDISGHIRDGSYWAFVEARVDGLCLSQAEIMRLVSMLVYSIDFRSPFTVTHTANTTAISGLLAELMGLDAATRQAVALGAFLHDVGKIGIPYAILESPGKLSKEEWDVMKTHVALSEEILQGIVPDEVCQIAVRHHEKLNGTGYCKGLTAAELTPAQRIVAVADVLSALLNRRSYKEAFSGDAAVAILRRMCEAGELCPQVCAVATDNFGEILRITKQADDPVMKLYEAIQTQYGELLAAGY